jgi:hypothetical protein
MRLPTKSSIAPVERPLFGFAIVFTYVCLARSADGAERHLVIDCERQKVAAIPIGSM